MIATRITMTVLVGLSLLLALILSIAPLPEFMHAARPLWLALLLSYWAYDEPYRFRISLALLAGLVQDVLYGTPFGFHALFLVFIVSAVLSFQPRLRMFPPWQQMIFVMLTCGVGQIAMLWLSKLVGNEVSVAQYIFPAVISGLLWPWVCMIMRFLRRLLQL